MKFLCVECDEAMQLTRTDGPVDGSLTVTFACPQCGRETAMLTNTMETQTVRSLGVKIGGRSLPTEPMEAIRGSLAHHHSGAQEAHPAVEPPAAGSGSKCPFTGVVADAYRLAAESGVEIAWTPEAEARVERVPSFARPMVRQGVEMHAREHGYTEINEAVVDEVKIRFGM